jgi:beta-glucanase (GH16 family)
MTRLLSAGTPRTNFRSKIAAIFTFAATLVLPAMHDAAFAQAPTVSGFDHAWSDEFNGTSLDTARWNVGDTTVTTNNSLQDYHPDQISVTGGNLVITSENTFSRGRNYKSGLVETLNFQQFGRFEVRAKLPSTQGTWPAIWLLSDEVNHPWPSQGEIDIMENRGTQSTLTSSAVHYGTNPPFNHNFQAREQSSVAAGNLQNYHDSFHNYAVEWTSDQVRFYVDDVHHSTVYDSDTGGFLSSNAGPMRLIINTAIGGDFLDNPNGSSQFPQTLEVDYVHAYTQSAFDPVLTFENGSFDANGGSLAKWSTFGSSINAGVNVRGDNQRILDGDGSLKLYGQFSGSENYSGVTQGISISEGDELFAEASVFVNSLDSIAGTDNQAFLNIDYFSKQYGLFGSSDYIGTDSIMLADGSTMNDAWIQEQLMSIAPAGAVEARLGLVFRQPGSAGGAVHIDGVNFSVVAVPEPSSLLGLAIMGAVAMGRSRRRRPQAAV